jgi:putative redox protein
MNRYVCVDTGHPKYVQDVSIGPHVFHTDEPAELGGTDAGPNPYELILAALGSCTAITVHMHAERRKWPLEAVRVRLSHARVHAQDCAQCDVKPATLDRVELEISLRGALTDEQRQRLLDVARHCPVHRTLTAGIRVELSVPP